MKYLFYCDYCLARSYGEPGQWETKCGYCDGPTERIPRPEEVAQESEKSERGWFAKCFDWFKSK